MHPSLKYIILACISAFLCIAISTAAPIPANCSADLNNIGNSIGNNNGSNNASASTDPGSGFNNGNNVIGSNDGSNNGNGGGTTSGANNGNNNIGSNLGSGNGNFDTGSHNGENNGNANGPAFIDSCNSLTLVLISSLYSRSDHVVLDLLYIQVQRYRVEIRHQLHAQLSAVSKYSRLIITSKTSTDAAP
ncbi:5870_t:CDS:2, partial [Ambispora leptoticha]